MIRLGYNTPVLAPHQDTSIRRETGDRGQGDTINRTMGKMSHCHSHTDSKDYQFSHAFNVEFLFMKVSLKFT